MVYWPDLIKYELYKAKITPRGIKPMTIKISKLSLALVQLQTAIDLFLNDRNYICALTLAGAAEEILGKLAEQVENTNACKELYSTVKSTLKLNIPPKKIGWHLNYYRNELKHFDIEENENLEIDIEAEAAHFILRALVNIEMHGKDKISNSETFIAWVLQNRPDIISLNDLT
jgi:hypothetical protein